MTKRTVDELSELEEFIAIACNEAGPPEQFDCPLRRVAHHAGGEVSTRAGGRVLGLADGEWGSFAEGFDGLPATWRAPAFFEMGARFRERFRSGEIAS